MTTETSGAEFSTGPRVPSATSELPGEWDGLLLGITLLPSTRPFTCRGTGGRADRPHAL